MCDFYEEDTDLLDKLLTINSASAFRALQIVTIVMFFGVNWTFLVILIFMGFKIRWIRDNMSLTTEL